MQKLKILRETSSWIAIDKPAGFHTHPPEDKLLRINPRWNALGILEKQFSQHIYPAHRLDRAASGILLYSRDRSKNAALQKQFASNQVNKTYFVLARGLIEGPLHLHSPLKNEAGAELTAQTTADPRFTFTLPIPHPRGGQRTFTVLAVTIGTGRFHQIRRHFAQAGFPLIGDSRHGDRKLNREFASLTGCRLLFLRCMSMEFTCPESNQPELLHTKWSREWHRLFDLAGVCALSGEPGLRASPSPAPQILS